MIRPKRGSSLRLLAASAAWAALVPAVAAAQEAAAPSPAPGAPATPAPPPTGPAPAAAAHGPRAACDGRASAGHPTTRGPPTLARGGDPNRPFQRSDRSAGGR